RPSMLARARKARRSRSSPCRSRPARAATGVPLWPPRGSEPLRTERIVASRLPLIHAVVDEMSAAVAVRAVGVGEVVARMRVEALPATALVEVAIPGRRDLPHFTRPAGVRSEVQLVVTVVVGGHPVVAHPVRRHVP